MAETTIRLERVEDWSAVKVGDPVRLTKGTAQINALVMQPTDGVDAWVKLTEFPVPLYESDGWVLERPVRPEPLPTVLGSMIRLRMVGGVTKEVQLDRRSPDSPLVWRAVGGETYRPEELLPDLISWEWIRKPEALVVEETRRVILNDVLNVIDTYVSPDGGAVEDDLRNAVARAVAVAGAQ